MQRIVKTVDLYDIATFTANRWAEESVFPRKPLDRTPPPKFAEIRERLPAPQWEGHADTIACYWKAWELAFGNLRIPEENIGFVSPYIDTSFNGCIFMWDHPDYNPDGGYWNGAVWAPTNYMVLRGLTKVGQDELAHEIACNQVENVAAAFVKQGTLFENYAPETAEGKCTPNFVGWTGVPPITVLFEYVFGLRPDVGARTLLWDVRLLEEHGVQRYPFGKGAELDLHCAQRQSPDEEPKIQANATTDLTLIVKWAHGEKTIKLYDGEARP